MILGNRHRQGLAGVALVGLVVLCFNTIGVEWQVLEDKAVHATSTIHLSNNLALVASGSTNASDDTNSSQTLLTTSIPLTTSLAPPNLTASSSSPSPAVVAVPMGTTPPSPPTPAPSPSTLPPTPTNPALGAALQSSYESVAMVTYVPTGHIKFINQAHHMLWSSWKYACSKTPRQGRGRTDLIFFAHRDVLAQMPESCVRLADASQVPPPSDQDQCFVVEQTPAPDDYWHRYSFMFSLTFLAEPTFHRLLMSYDRLLRTDTDVVVTPAFLTFRPREFVVGRGGYMIEDYTKTRIKEVAADLGLTHQSLYNVGSTWFGNASMVLQMVPKMLEVAKYILESPKYGIDQGFPRWHIGVTSMYAGELVVNHFLPKDNVWINADSVDINCNGQEKTADVYHSHCWPGDQYLGHFNKWAYERGEYTETRFPREALDLTVINDYFMAMALYGQ